MKILFLIIFLSMIVGCQTSENDLPPPIATDTSIPISTPTNTKVPTTIPPSETLSPTLTLILTDTPDIPTVSLPGMLYFFTADAVYKYDFQNQGLEFIQNCTHGVVCAKSTRFLCFDEQITVHDLAGNVSVNLGSLPSDGYCVQGGKYYLYGKILDDKLFYYAVDLNSLGNEEIFQRDERENYAYIFPITDQSLEFFVIFNWDKYEIHDRKINKIFYFDPPTSNHWSATGDVAFSPSSAQVIFGIDPYYLEETVGDFPSLYILYIAENITGKPSLLATAPEGFDYTQTNSLTGINRIDNIWSPDGERLSPLADKGGVNPSERRSRLCIITIDTKEQKCIFLKSGIDYIGPIWSPDSRYVGLVYCTLDGTDIWIYDVQDKRQFDLNIVKGKALCNSPILWK
jgi:hypothetical protein